MEDGGRSLAFSFSSFANKTLQVLFPERKAETLSEQEKEWIDAFHGIYVPARRIAVIINRPTRMITRYLKEKAFQKLS